MATTKLYAVVLDSGGKVIQVKRLEDGAMIPVDPLNKDYQEFLAYQKAGGDVSPEPPPPPDPTSTAIDQARAVMMDPLQPIAQRFDALLVCLSFKKPTISAPLAGPPSKLG